jgi:SAM-dependent methyltransferase
MTTYQAAHFTDNTSRATVWKALSQHLAASVPANAEVLEIGAGYCHWINNVRAARRVAVDTWPELPEFAAPGVRPVVLDIRHGLLSLGVSSFDVVLASNLLEHFSADEAAAILAEVAQLLRSGGRVILIQPNFRYAWRQYFDDYTHRAIFTDVSLPALLRSQGFVIEDVRPRFLPYSMRAARVPITGWLVTAYLWSPVKPWAGQMLVIARKE